MTLIEIYKEKNRVFKRLKNDVLQITGKDSPRNDKFQFTSSFLRMDHRDWSPLILSIRMSHGYFGSSSAYSNTSEEMGQYLAKAIDINHEILLATVLKLAEEDVKSARENAEKEALEVLNKIEVTL